MVEPEEGEADADRQQRGAGEHEALGRVRAQGERRDRRRWRQRHDDQAAGHVARRVQQRDRQRGAQREVQAAQRPRRDQDRRDRDERPPQVARDADAGPQGAEPVGPAHGHRLRHRDHHGQRQDEGPGQEPEDQPQRVGPVLHQEPRAEGARGEAEQRRRAADHRAELRAAWRLEVDEGRAERAGGDARRQALHDARGEERVDVAGDREQRHGDELDQQRADEHRPPAEAVRERAGDHERQQQRADVDREDRVSVSDEKCQRPW